MNDLKTILTVLGTDPHDEGEGVRATPAPLPAKCHMEAAFAEGYQKARDDLAGTVPIQWYEAMEAVVAECEDLFTAHKDDRERDGWESPEEPQSLIAARRTIKEYAPLPQHLTRLSGIQLAILNAHECEKCAGTGTVETVMAIPNEFTDCPECKGGYISPQPVASVSHQAECISAGVWESVYLCACGTRFTVNTEDGGGQCPNSGKPGASSQPSELEMHRTDYNAIKSAGFESPGELLDAYKKLSKQAAAVPPEGKVIVPVEPDSKILDAMQQAPKRMTPMAAMVDNTIGGRELDILRYKAAIAASHECGK